MNEPSWISELKVIVWDMDGTLYPGDPRIDQTFDRETNQALAQHLGITPSEAEVRFQELYRGLRSHTLTITKMGLEGRKFLTDLWDKVPLEEYLQPNPALVAALRHSKWRHRILSNSNRLDQIERKLRILGFSPDDFEAIHTSVTLGVEKPDPACFHAVQFATQLTPNALLMVGDRPQTDILPAQSAGWHGCLVRSEDPRAQLCVADPLDVFKLEPTAY